LWSVFKPFTFGKPLNKKHDIIANNVLKPQTSNQPFSILVIYRQKAKFKFKNSKKGDFGGFQSPEVREENKKKSKIPALVYVVFIL